MKTAAFFAAVSIHCLCSCEKESLFDYGSSSGEDVGDYTALIALTFSSDASDCIIGTGIEGLFASNQYTRRVEWSDKTSISLYEDRGDYKLLTTAAAYPVKSFILR